MLTLRKRWGSSQDGTVRKDILFPPKGGLRVEGTALFWLIAGWELQCSRLEWAAGWNRKAEGWREAEGMAEAGRLDVSLEDWGGGGSKDTAWVSCLSAFPPSSLICHSSWLFPSTPITSFFSFSCCPPRLSCSAANSISSRGVLALFSSLKLHTVLCVSCPSPDGRDPPLPILQLSSSSSSLVHRSMLGEWRSLWSCAEVRRRAPPIRPVGEGAALSRRLKRAMLGWRLPDSSRFSAMSSRGWKCISSLGILSRDVGKTYVILFWKYHTWTFFTVSQPWFHHTTSCIQAEHFHIFFHPEFPT